MGHVTCGKHGCLCCWNCDRCPQCQPETGKLLRGEYCHDCTEKFKASGMVWSTYYQNWIKPEPVEQDFGGAFDGFTVSSDADPGL